MNTPYLLACHQCDALSRIEPLPPGSTARCWRCGTVLIREIRNSLDRTLALTITGLILYVLANSFPLLLLNIQSQNQQTSLILGVVELWSQGMWMVAALVMFTIMVIPLLYLLGLLYVLLPLRLGYRPPYAARVFVWTLSLRPWNMVEVFMIGILVAIVKLIHMATIVPGLAMYSFAALIVVLTGSMAVLNPQVVWEKLETGS